MHSVVVIPRYSIELSQHWLFFINDFGIAEKILSARFPRAVHSFDQLWLSNGCLLCKAARPGNYSGGRRRFCL